MDACRILLNIIIYFVGIGEAKRVTRFFELKWWLLGIEDEDEYEAAPLTSARKTYEKFFAQDGGPIPSSEAQDGEQNPSSHAQDQDDGEPKPSNQFGRGQPLSSVSTGWKPKPIQWMLLGGAGGGTRKKTKPKTKAQESQDGN